MHACQIIQPADKPVKCARNAAGNSSSSTQILTVGVAYARQRWYAQVVPVILLQPNSCIRLSEFYTPYPVRSYPKRLHA
jgi:hypothetical protein